MFLVGDAHSHVNPMRGIGPERLARKFKESGGWFISVVSLLSWSYKSLALQVKDYLEVFKENISASKIIKRNGVEGAAIIGVHPAEIVTLLKHGLEREKVEELVLGAYSQASKLVEEGEAKGLGEVGRPHFPASKTALDLCNKVFNKVLEMSHDLDCIVHIHVERGGLKTIVDVAERCRKKGVKKALLHHADPRHWKTALSYGLKISIPARTRDLMEVFRVKDNFGIKGLMIESDFLDDPRRPGAVVAPWAIKRNFEKLVVKGLITEKDAEKVLIQNISNFYSVSLP